MTLPTPLTGPTNAKLDTLASALSRRIIFFSKRWILTSRRTYLGSRLLCWMRPYVFFAFLACMENPPFYDAHRPNRGLASMPYSGFHFLTVNGNTDHNATDTDSGCMGKCRGSKSRILCVFFPLIIEQPIPSNLFGLRYTILLVRKKGSAI